jgi:SAM-dependent MidA family methyltransferase
LITIKEDLDAVTSILHQTFELPPFKRDYDSAFGKVANIIKRHGIVENARNLRFRFILCMQEFFDSIPQEQWKTKDLAFIKESEEFSINKFKDWIIEQIT